MRRPPDRKLVLAALVLTPVLYAGDNWPQFRGPNGDGVAEVRAAPVRWSETENIRWKVAIHDKGWSSPVIWGEQIWLTTAGADGKAFFAVCVDRTSGKIVHDIKLFTEERPAYCIPYNSYASPTPVIEAAPLAALDLPLRVVVWEDGYQTLVSYSAPAAVARRYGLDGDLADALASIDALTSAVIDR